MGALSDDAKSKSRVIQELNGARAKVEILQDRLVLLEAFAREVVAEAKRCEAAFRDMNPRHVLNGWAALKPEGKP